MKIKYDRATSEWFSKHIGQQTQFANVKNAICFTSQVYDINAKENEHDGE